MLGFFHSFPYTRASLLALTVLMHRTGLTQQFDVTAGEQPSRSKRSMSAGQRRRKLLQRSFVGDTAEAPGAQTSALRWMRRLVRQLFRGGVDEDGPATEWKGLAYFRVGCTLGLALLDIITAFTVQIFWLDRSSPRPNTRVSGGHVRHLSSSFPHNHIVEAVD